MLRLASDEDVHGAIIRGLQRRLPQLDLVHVKQHLPLGAHDSEVLDWAAREDRVLITNDRNTMVHYANERVAAHVAMPGVIVTTNRQAIGPAIADLVLLAECLTHGELQGQIRFLPLK